MDEGAVASTVNNASVAPGSNWRLTVTSICADKVSVNRAAARSKRVIIHEDTTTAPLLYEQCEPKSKAEPRVCVAQCLFHFGGPFTSREDEAQVTGAFRQGFE